MSTPFHYQRAATAPRNLGRGVILSWLPRNNVPRFMEKTSASQGRAVLPPVKRSKSTSPSKLDRKLLMETVSPAMQRLHQAPLHLPAPPRPTPPNSRMRQPAPAA